MTTARSTSFSNSQGGWEILLSVTLVNLWCHPQAISESHRLTVEPTQSWGISTRRKKARFLQIDGVFCIMTLQISEAITESLQQLTSFSMGSTRKKQRYLHHHRRHYYPSCRCRHQGKNKLCQIKMYYQQTANYNGGAPQFAASNKYIWKRRGGSEIAEIFLYLLLYILYVLYMERIRRVSHAGHKASSETCCVTVIKFTVQ